MGSLRRECLDHVIALNERQVCRIVSNYARFYNREPIWPLRRTLPSPGMFNRERMGGSSHSPRRADSPHRYERVWQLERLEW